MVFKRRRWGIAVISLLLVFILHRWLPGFANMPLAEPLPQDPYIQVYLNQSQANTYQDPYRGIKRYGDDLEAVIVDAIAQAQTSIDVAVQEINLPQIALALRDRAQAGVTVRIVIENQYNRVWQPLSDFQAHKLDDRQSSKHAEQEQMIDANHNGKITARELDQGDAIRILQKAPIPLIDDTADGSKGSGLMHHKFLVVDGKTVLLGSANLTLSGLHGDFAHPDSRGNANALLKIESAELASVLGQEFALMWGDGPKGKEDSLFGLQKPQRSPQTVSIPGSAVTVQFSPTSESKPWSQSVNGLISRTLAQANQAVDLALFVFSDQGIANTLAQKSEAGVTVQALVDANFIYRSYSEALDMLGTATPDHRCQLEANNRPWKQPIAQVGTPALPVGDKLHHKFALIDNETVIIGSHNWSAAANHNNDEDLLVIRNPTVAAHFRREFNRLMTDAQLGMHPDLRDRLQRQRKQCGLP
ncbi:MAG: phospholipase D-like domain-containing protein [Cyanobacteria bacterium J06638_28]